MSKFLRKCSNCKDEIEVGRGSPLSFHCHNCGHDNGSSLKVPKSKIQIPKPQIKPPKSKFVEIDGNLINTERIIFIEKSGFDELSRVLLEDGFPIKNYYKVSFVHRFIEITKEEYEKLKEVLS